MSEKLHSLSIEAEGFGVIYLGKEVYARLTRGKYA